MGINSIDRRQVSLLEPLLAYDKDVKKRQQVRGGLEFQGTGVSTKLLD